MHTITRLTLSDCPNNLSLNLYFGSEILWIKRSVPKGLYPQRMHVFRFCHVLILSPMYKQVLHLSFPHWPSYHCHASITRNLSVNPRMVTRSCRTKMQVSLRFCTHPNNIILNWKEKLTTTDQGGYRKTTKGFRGSLTPTEIYGMTLIILFFLMITKTSAD